MLHSKKILILEKQEIILAGLSSFFHDKIEQIEIYNAANLEAAGSCMEDNKIDVLLWSLYSSDIDNFPRNIEKNTSIILFYDDFEAAIRVTKLSKQIRGLVSKAAKPSELVECIQAMFCNTSYYCKATLHDALNFHLVAGGTSQKRINNAPGRRTVSTLSKKQQQVYDLLVQGKSTSTIAAILGLKSTTISTVKSTIFRKMNVSNVIELLG
ncbi:LuxR C-terminal-related transcriptional regulator [Dyadobacter sp. CY312]|uniref:LuxR C-terminal-related transcriptional regulator n=1 Tax=Dyadobacter sp. CY312 TaxID=2907303 RepID=UPI001F1F3FCA|nr:LuxR C-terminal-related transcriptional regulator [Dyadobacter sp. CY312]MCE7044587.1 LuxR C-terminal-related transcriptional regulator [Dyadobacter sp. CY312]